MPYTTFLFKFARNRLLLLVTVFVSLVFAAHSAHAQSESVLYSFCAKPSCADGAVPLGSLIRDSKGNLYGTTRDGGAFGQGSVFKITSKGAETVLYSFCERSGCADGASPWASLLRDSAGNLYGTTANGGGTGCGGAGCGTVFELTATGTERVLYRFTGGADGAHPTAALVRDSNGNLYGAAYLGGGADNCGTVFKVTPAGVETVLYSFGFSDGCNPHGSLVRDSKGNLYGTTLAGGASRVGTVFKISPTLNETVLHSFGGGPADGEYPEKGLVRDTKGNLYGTTAIGGATFNGTVFEVTPAGTETVLYSFKGGTDGSLPSSTVVMDTQGNLYGTTSNGGGSGCGTGCGTVFEISATGTERVLYSFADSPDGSHPYAGLLQDANGNLYGTTSSGGASLQGTVFKVVP